MDRLISKYFVILLSFCAWLIASAGENLLPNGEFADGLKHWNTHFPESNEQNYARNHEWVALEKTRGKPELVFSFPGPVADSEGVKAVTELVPVSGKPTDQLEFGAELMSEGPSVIIFIEGYQVAPEQQEKGNDHYPGYVRTYRATIHVKAKKNEWATVKRIIKPFERDRYAPSHILIKLYAFHPAGTVRFRQAFLRKADAN